MYELAYKQMENTDTYKSIRKYKLLEKQTAHVHDKNKIELIRQSDYPDQNWPAVGQ